MRIFHEVYLRSTGYFGKEGIKQFRIFLFFHELMVGILDFKNKIRQKKN